MKAILRRERERFFTGKIMLLVFGCCLFSLSERQTTEYSYVQFMLHMLSEHYYITYFMMPVFLLVVYKSLDDEVDYVLIRSRYYWRYFWTKALAFSLNIVGFVLVQIAVIMLVAIGLSTEQTFTVAARGNLAEILQIYAKYFHTPIMAIIAASGYMMMGLAIMSILFLVVHHYFGKKVVSIVMISLYVLMTFGLKIPGLNKVPFLFMNNYILLYYNYSSANSLMISVLSMALIIVITMILVKFYWNKQLNWSFELRGKGIAFYYARYLFTMKNVLVLTSIISFITIWKLINVTAFPRATSKDFFTSLFYGHGVDEFYLIGFLEMLILNGVPLYLFAIFMEKIHREENLGLTIRLRTKRNWARTILRIAVTFIVMYVGMMVGISLVFAVMQGLPLDGGLGLVIQVSVLKFLDITFQLLLFILLFIWRRNVTLAFLIVLGTNFVGLLPITWAIYFPTGLSSLARNTAVIGEGGGVSFFIAALIMGVFVSVQWVYIQFKGYQKVLGG